MTKNFSLYLDCLRFLAAVAVFLGHVSTQPFTDGTVWWRFVQYGDISVTVFFVLSGYVISYVVATRETTLRAYMAARVARLYSVAGIALVLTSAFDNLGLWLRPDFYQIQKVLWKPQSLEGYFSSLVFLNEYQVFSFNGIAPGTNAPYWSLSFEVTYYVIAGLILFLRPIISIPLTFILLAAAGQTIAALLPIWLAGFFLYRAKVAVRASASGLAILIFISAVGILAAPIVIGHLPNSNKAFWFPWGRAPFNRNLVTDYFVALVFAAHLVCVRSLLSFPFDVPRKIEDSIRWLGSLTFPLYCFHYPAICLLAAISPWPHASIMHLAFLCFATAMLVALLTPLCEATKIRIRCLIS